MKQLTFRRNERGAIEAIDEHERTTLDLTFGECVEMLRWYFDDVPPVYRMALPGDWHHEMFERITRRVPPGEDGGRGGAQKNFDDPPPTDRPRSEQ